MEKIFDYKNLFDQALNKIKNIRAPRVNRLENKDLQWDTVQEQALFHFGGEDFEKSVAVYKGANEISVSCLEFIIKKLFEKYEYTVKAVNIDKSLNKKLLDRIRFALKDMNSETLLLFKDIEESGIWKTKGKEPKEIQDIMRSCKCSKCIYIYLMYDYAYLQVIGHNDDETEPGRGYNLYSLRWFFEKYFGIEEYKHFKSAVTAYQSEVDSYIGYVTIKTLIPSSLINFRKNVERSLVNFHYVDLLSLKYNNHELCTVEYDKIKSQFLEDNTLRTMLGARDFAESLITAEWLYDSMNKAKAIDLTVIGMGYFKAVEQLLYDLICLHSNEGLKIKKDYSRKDLPAEVQLNEDNIKEKAIDVTLGSMAVFVKNNAQILFRNDITWKTKKYVIEAIFSYTDIRNGYFHKENIHDIRIIEKIRNASFYMFFLLLGASNLKDEYLIKLGLPQNTQDDYYRLCEFIDLHRGFLLVLDFGDNTDKYGLACSDSFSRIIDYRYVQYSGVYIKDVEGGRVHKFTADNLPRTIYLGKFDMNKETVSLEPKKENMIYDNGKYVGPSYAEQDEITY